ncbi:MAG: AAA family ATPase [Actinobacteria bacterium]|nr:AAA family ATPase [Actinomycetota bacterium]
MRDLPTGTVTFLFSDIEGSTRLVQSLGDEYIPLLEDQQRLLRSAFGAHGGTVLGTEGDSFFVVFPAAVEAIAAAVDAQRAVAKHGWPQGATVHIRMGLHTGEGTLGGDNYVGLDVHRAARIAGVAHGGQVLMSESTRSLVEQSIEGEASLRDLGEHRLKDLLKPERIFQIVHPELPSEFPPLASLSYRPNNLPTQTSEFLGREADLNAISNLIDAGVRLITLTGPGGIGKTRLALQVAAARTDVFRDGLYFVDLSPVRDPDKAFDAAVRALGLQSASDQRTLDVLKDQLADKHLLLVLDNFEQVMDAAEGVADLLRSCPKLSALVTTREALKVRGEHVHPVAPMSLPSTDEVSAAAECEAVRLFVERAVEARGTFTLTEDNAGAVVEICTRLDGLPLAIELAAARLTLFSPHDLRDRLRNSLQIVGGGARDLPARQQTLRRTIEWSYELLDINERNLFRILSVFSTASVDAVEEVAASAQLDGDAAIIDRLSSLVDKSLVRSANGSGPQRLSMLATIHEFAAERLEEDPGLAAATQRAHAEYFSGFARDRRAQLAGSERSGALDELEVEIGNLLAAWRYLVDAGDLATLEELFDAVWILHEARGWYASAVELARDLLEVLTSVPSTPDRVQQKITLATSLARGLLAVGGYTKEVEEAYGNARALLEEAGGLPHLYPVLRSVWSFHLYRAEFDQALAVGRQLLDLAEHSDDENLMVDAQLVVGSNLISMGEPTQGLLHLDRSITMFDPRRHRSAPMRLGANPGVVAHTTSAFTLWLLGDPDLAIERSTRALELAAQLYHPFTLAYALYHVGFLALWQSDYESVLERADAAVRVAEEHGYQVWRAVGLVLGGTALIALGRPEEGLARSDQGIALYQEISTPPVFWPFVLTIRARGFGLAGRPQEGVDIIDQVLEMIGDRFDLLSSEFPMIKGDLLLATSRRDEAEQWFERALDIAKQTGARTTELRAATRLARLTREPKSIEILRSARESFVGKVETADVAEARAVLEDG